MALAVAALSACSQNQTTQHEMLNRPSTAEEFKRYTLYFGGDSIFKAFALSNSGALSWRVRSTPEAAIRDAITSCASNNYGGDCRLFAVGNKIVWDMSDEERQATVMAYSREKTALDLPEAPLSSASLWALQIYWKVEDCDKFKVFLLADNGAWTKLDRPTYEEVLEDAFSLCDYYAGRPGLCRLFAVGNTVVWDLQEGEIAGIVEDYRKPRSCS
ncbi:MAG: hypothetical protein GTO67_12910 [Gammaproteobacteria bacterium]|nr:hypothetical protein [Gammaproteobacteria bacterium]NIN39472.1 hypothetical protein [Gammaproteobacteria bacterium]NIT17202.1 hypothetical protein [Gammaproteobacteria bacterium]